MELLFLAPLSPGRLARAIRTVMGVGVEDDGTELSEAIRAVRAGLAAAQAEGDSSSLRFTVKDIVLDLGIELRSTAAAGGGVKAFVVSAEARGERVAARSHRLTVTLEVHENPLIGDRRDLDPLHELPQQL